MRTGKWKGEPHLSLPSTSPSYCRGRGGNSFNPWPSPLPLPPIDKGMTWRIQYQERDTYEYRSDRLWLVELSTVGFCPRNSDGPFKKFLRESVCTEGVTPSSSTSNWRRSGKSETETHVGCRRIRPERNGSLSFVLLSSDSGRYTWTGTLWVYRESSVWDVKEGSEKRGRVVRVPSSYVVDMDSSTGWPFTPWSEEKNVHLRLEITTKRTLGKVHRTSPRTTLSFLRLWGMIRLIPPFHPSYTTIDIPVNKVEILSGSFLKTGQQPPKDMFHVINRKY